MKLTLDIGPHRIEVGLWHSIAHDDDETEQRDSTLDAWVSEVPQPDLTQHPVVGFGGSHE